MNCTVGCYVCTGYEVDKILPLLEEIYRQTQGPELNGKTVLVKPNILQDEATSKAVTTHPVFLEAVIRFLQSRQAGKIYVGDSPGFHAPSFIPRKSGIYEVCEKTGAEWVYFAKNATSISLPSGKTPVAAIIHEVDYFFSIPKLKTHELMGYTGAIKNTLGLIPHIHKAKQHAIHRNSRDFAAFLVDLNENITPDYIFMDGITAMEGPGPGNGIPFPLHIALGSTNLLAIDIVASRIIGYDPLQIETNLEGLNRRKWLSSIDDVIVQGVDIEQVVRTDFKRIPRVSTWKMSFNVVLQRIPGFRRTEREPVFFKKRCTGCKACLNICPVQVLRIDPGKPHKVLIDRKDCIRCFCCHEVCPNNAIEIK